MSLTSNHTADWQIYMSIRDCLFWQMLIFDPKSWHNIHSKLHLQYSQSPFPWKEISLFWIAYMFSINGRGSKKNNDTCSKQKSFKTQKYKRQQRKKQWFPNTPSLILSKASLLLYIYVSHLFFCPGCNFLHKRISW